MTDSPGRDLQSMTGYGAAEGHGEGIAWRWELRSVNGRGLDAKFRLPAGTEGLEPALRPRLGVLHRGTVNANLRIEREDTPAALTIDEDGLAAAVAAIGKVRTAIDCAKPRPEAVLGMRGVLVAAPLENQVTDAQLALLADSFGTALAALREARRAEGARVAAVLEERCRDMTRRVETVRRKTLGAREQIAGRLRQQLGELLSEHVTPERLAQEAAILAIRADVTEELDRLAVHATSFAELLAAGGAVGRRLEFLSQELMREASTLTAKLHSAELKHEGLDLKELIDGLREQVLNLA